MARDDLEGEMRASGERAGRSSVRQATLGEFDQNNHPSEVADSSKLSPPDDELEDSIEKLAVSLNVLAKFMGDQSDRISELEGRHDAGGENFHTAENWPDKAFQ